MRNVSDLMEAIATLDVEFWDLVHEGKYDSPRARELSEQLRVLKARRAVEIDPSASVLEDENDEKEESDADD